MLILENERPCIEFDTVEWALPESILATLWDSVFQRMIVFLWYLELHKHPYGPVNIKYPISNDLKKRLDHTGTDPNKLNHDFFSCNPIERPDFSIFPPNGNEGLNVGRHYLINIMQLMLLEWPAAREPRFNAELTLLINYFGDRPDDEVQPVPVYFLEGDGYDYILSSKGLELVAPPRPFGKRERATGCIKYESQETKADGAPLELDEVNFLVDDREKKIQRVGVSII